MEEIINFNSVIKRYGKITALNGLSFSIKKGESVGLIGNNGCGKTTTINVLCNLVNYDSGNVLIYGNKIIPGFVTYKNKLGILLSPPIFVNEFTPIQYLKFVCKFQKVDQFEIDLRIESLIKSFNLNSFNKKKIGDFSSGDKMKIALAAAIIHNPEVLVFDEPFIHLDFQTIDFISSLIKSLRNKKTLFITSHNIDLMTNLCSRFLIMDHGQIINDIALHENMSHNEIKSLITDSILKQNIRSINMDWFE
ncbi:MAG TPA: ABC transporter ATP-binding protein [Bacteroidales bacterium]|jgi:ABC-2 type transport system ATP-binding protein|nr:ABC transporter ATP-binding protein [Bacteroidales bacterium]HQH23843.1 ABC transporter ATP-binding protein [Bacteroidales bacterium]HQJ81668.1 ABC transporter ATP-binding protein [Bacteroidales bacterium]